MGIGIHSATHLCKLTQKVPLGGDLLTLGVQDAVFTKDHFERMALQYSLAPPPEGWEPQINERMPYKEQGYLTGASLWSYLGFSSVTTLDVDDYEDASVMVDLNHDGVPQELENRFDVIFDGGTIEHVFHLPNALKNLCKMTKVGGMIIHQTPSLPLIDHGFYMFSPTFFHDYYTSNGFEIVDLRIAMYSYNHLHEPCWFMDYTPGSLAWVSDKGYCFPGMNFLIMGAFRKTEGSTGEVVPQQGAYQQHWKTALERKRFAKGSPGDNTNETAPAG